MKRFLTLLISFVVPIIVFAYVADSMLTNALKKSRRLDYSVWNDLTQSNINSDMVIYGSSRAWIQINPKIIEDSTGLNTYNLGMDGYNFHMEYLRHRMLMDKNKHPKLIIVSLDYFTLEKRKDLFNYQQFLPYLKDKDIQAATSSYKGFSFYDYNFPLVRYAGEPKTMLMAMEKMILPNRKVREKYKGFRGSHKKWNTALENFLLTAPKMSVKIDTSLITLFDSFLNETKSNGIDVIFVYTPEYVLGQTHIANRDSIFNIYYEFSKKYNIPFYDYSNDTLSHNKKYFYNSGHLNAEGADLFTREFVTKIKAEQLKSNVYAK